MANWLTKLFGGTKEEKQPDNISEEMTQDNVPQPEEDVEHKEAPVASEPETREDDNSEERESHNSQENEEEKTW